MGIISSHNKTNATRFVSLLGAELSKTGIVYSVQTLSMYRYELANVRGYVKEDDIIILEFLLVAEFYYLVQDNKS